MDAAISEGPGHSVRLDYRDGDVSMTLLWEPVAKGHVLETKFSSSCSILDQRLIKLGNAAVKDIAEAFMEQHSLEPLETVFEEPKLEAKCPSCGSGRLDRYAKSVKSPNSVPVMPIYQCRECGAKSYHLTDAYLKKLAVSNPGMFELKDLKSMAEDEERFIKELREYIVRIFASKKILSIKP